MLFYPIKYNTIRISLKHIFCITQMMINLLLCKALLSTIVIDGLYCYYMGDKTAQHVNEISIISVTIIIKRRKLPLGTLYLHVRVVNNNIFFLFFEDILFSPLKRQ